MPGFRTAPERGSFLRRSLIDVVARDHRQTPPALRRRRVVTAAFGVLGAVLLGASLRIEPGNPWFYPSALALAATWAIGAFASGPLHLGRTAGGGRPLLDPVLLGLGMAGVFVVGALVVREIEPLADQVANVLTFATEGALPALVVVTAVTGVSEELFFRGAVHAAVTRRPVVWTAALYVLATAATGNVMLTFAASLLGVVVGLQRRASGGVLAPILTHLTWSLTMLLALPPLFGLR